MAGRIVLEATPDRAGDLFDQAVTLGFRPDWCTEVPLSDGVKPRMIARDMAAIQETYDQLDRIWELRMYHPDGNVVRFFPRAGDGKARMIEYPPGGTDRPTGPTLLT